MSKTRDELLAALNVATENAAQIRDADSVDFDALSDATVRVDSIRSELAALDARQPNPIAFAPAERPRSFGERAAEMLSDSPIGSSFNLETRLLAQDPTGGLDALGETVVDVSWPQVEPNIREAYQRVPKFIDIVPTVSTSADTVNYIEESGFTNNAAERLQGKTTAESELSFVKRTFPIVNVAHYIAATEETLADAPALASLINKRGVGGLRQVIGDKMVFDPGIGEQMGSFQSAVVNAGMEHTLSSDGLFDDLLSYKTLLQDTGSNPTHIVMTPAKWTILLKEKLASGEYVGSGPFGPLQQPSIWGLPVVLEPGLGSRIEAMVVDNSALAHYVRDTATVASDRDLLTGVVNVRVQTRSQLAIYRPIGVQVIVNAEAPL